MLNLTYYVIFSDVKLNDGESIAMSKAQKNQITESKGKYVEGNILKIEY